MLYIYVGGGKGRTSIKVKISQIISKFNDQGLPTKGLFISQYVDKKGFREENIEEIPVPFSSRKYFTTWFQHDLNIRTLHAYLKDHHQKFDVIFLRYPSSNKALYRLLKEFGNKILIEHNTKQYEEMKHLHQDLKFGIRPSIFLSWFQNKILLPQTENYWARRTLPLAKMGLAVTDDIAEYEMERAHGKYTCYPSPNGILVDKIKFRNYIPIEENHLRLGLISGATNAAPYIGIDRILNGFANYSGSVKITLVLIGKLFVHNQQLVDRIKGMKNVEVLGQLGAEELNKAFERIHVSIGTVALHRIKMREGSVLKVNDSISRGVPIVIAHKDMELKYCPQFRPYFFVAPADDSALDFKKIADFALGLSKDKEHPTKIRKLAKKHTDLEPKIKKVIQKIKTQFELVDL